MKKLIVGLLIIGVGFPAQASFHLGLGKAVAKKGSSVFTKAADKEYYDSINNTLASLPACDSSTLYSASPISLSDLNAIDPLGHVNPSGHTLPSDHIYFYLKPVDPAAPYGTRVTTNLIAPGNITVTSIAYSYTNGNTATTDYGIYFYACREVKSYFLHVKSIDTTLQEKLAAARQNCTDYTTGGALFHRCDAAVDIKLSAGDIMGTVGGSAAAFDFGTYDYRQTPLAFVSPTRHYSDQPYTVCPANYFESSLKSTMETYMGRFDGAQPRTALPLCGEINFDVAGTAMGDWYKIGSPDSPEDPHLALIKDNIYNPRQDISVGTSVPGVNSTFYPFDPLSTGTHNRDFSQVTADNQVYCYDTFYDPIGQPASPGYSILITMPTATTLRVEKYNAASCGSGPWTMGSSYAEFQR